MLKYEHIQVGQKILAQDFDPRNFHGSDIGEQYVTGTVKQHDWANGAKILVIDCDYDSVNWGDDYSRVGSEVFVPMQTLLDWPGRVMVVE